MTATPLPDEMTIDELAAAVGTTVRTTRYYATLGLLPPPERRGRVGYYGPVHRARLELVRALADHGFTLQAIEGFLREVPDDAGVEELALQRAMLTSWTARAPRTMSLAELELEAGRPLGPDELAVLRLTGAVIPTDGASPAGYVEGVYSVMPHLDTALGLLDVDVPAASLALAEDAISRHMSSLADELTSILHSQVLEPFRARQHSPAEAAAMEQTMDRLRQLTLEAVVSGFQRAANQVITRSLSSPTP